MTGDLEPAQSVQTTSAKACCWRPMRRTLGESVLAPRGLRVRCVIVGSLGIFIHPGFIAARYNRKCLFKEAIPEDERGGASMEITCMILTTNDPVREEL